jgi:flagellar hook-basal body complex protein FliE
MIEMEISRVLAQMRTVASEVRGPAVTPAETGGTNFADVLKQAVSSVNQQQTTATEMVRQFETGSGETSVAEVMIAMQKASLSFQAMTEVRNRLVDAYQQIMNMPV